MSRIQFIHLFILIGVVVICCKRKTDVLINTVYHVTFTLQGITDNSRNNSGFIFKAADTIPPLYLTAHHVASGHDKSKYYDWDSLQNYFSDASIWSIQDNTVHFQLGKNLPIPNAKVSEFASALDLAAFYVAPGGAAGYLKPAPSPAKVGDTVRLFSRLMQTNSLLHPGIVIYASDSLFVYQLLDRSLTSLGGSSGSPVLNDKDEVVSNSFGGLPLSSTRQREGVAREYPFILQFLNKTEMGRMYGIGVPISLIRTSLIQAIQMDQNLMDNKVSQ